LNKKMKVEKTVARTNIDETIKEFKTRQ